MPRLRDERFSRSDSAPEIVCCLFNAAGLLVVLAVLVPPGVATPTPTSIQVQGGTPQCLPDSDGCWVGPWNWACQINPGPDCPYGEIAHAALIPKGPYRGMVLIWRRECDNGSPIFNTQAWILDPVHPELLLRVNAPLLSSIFCASASWDSNGALVVAGGARTSGSPPGEPKETYRFLPGALGYPPTSFTAPGCPTYPLVPGTAWTYVDDTSIGRWYPSVITLMKGVIAQGTQFERPSSSTLLIGGSDCEASCLPGPTPPIEFWQTLPPRGYVPPGWSHTLYPDGGGSHTPPSSPTPEQYVRRAVAGQSLPNPRLDTYPRALQLSDMGPFLERKIRNVFVPGDTNTVYPDDHRKPEAGATWVMRLRYPGANLPAAELWRGPESTQGVARNRRHYGNAVLLHTLEANFPDSDGYNRVIALNGAHNTNLAVGPAFNWLITETVEEFDPNNNPAEAGAWVTKSVDLQTPRLYGNSVVLPTRDILVIGGAARINSALHAVTGPPGQPGEFEHRPELYSPGLAGASGGASSTMMERSPNAPGNIHPYSRLYHNVAVLLPDGRIVHIGGADEDDPGDYSFGGYTGEIFSPPYLGYGFRPTIADISATEIVFGASFDVFVQHTQTMDRFVLLRPAAVTHQVDADQRYIELVFQYIGVQEGVKQYRLSAPAEDLGPAGYYMLFAVERDAEPVPRRAPSVAQFILLK